MDWGGFGEKVQVSHHTPFYWLHLRKTNKTKQLSSLGFMYWNITRNLSFLSEGSWLASVYTWFGLLCSDRHCVDIYLVMSCSWVITLTKSPMVSRKIKAKYVLHVTSRNMNPCTSLTSFKYIVLNESYTKATAILYLQLRSDLKKDLVLHITEKVPLHLKWNKIYFFISSSLPHKTLSNFQTPHPYARIPENTNVLLKIVTITKETLIHN